MYITFDYRCPEGHHEERFVKKSEMDDQWCNHIHESGFGKLGKTCDAPMTRLPAGTRTTFRYADTKLKD